MKSKLQPNEKVTATQLVDMIEHLFDNSQNPRVQAAGILRDLTTQGFFERVAHGVYVRTRLNGIPKTIGFNKRITVEPQMRKDAKDRERTLLHHTGSV